MKTMRVLLVLVLSTNLVYGQAAGDSATNPSSQRIDVKTLASNIQKLQEALKVIAPDSPAYKPLLDEYMQQTAQLTSVLSGAGQTVQPASLAKSANPPQGNAPLPQAPQPKQQMVLRSAVLTAPPNSQLVSTDEASGQSSAPGTGENSGNAQATTPASATTNAPCVIIASNPSTSTDKSTTTYAYSIQCAAGTTPSSMTVTVNNPPAASALSNDQALAYAKAIAQAQGVVYSSYSSGTATFSFRSGVPSNTIQVTLPTSSTTQQLAQYVITSGNNPPSASSCTANGSGCSVGAIMVPVPNAADNSTLPAGFDPTQGNTLFTKATAGVMMAGATSSSPQSKLFADFYLTAPLWAPKPKETKNTPECIEYTNAKTKPPLDAAKLQQLADRCQLSAFQIQQDRQFRDPLNSRIWAYFHPQITSIPQSNIALGSLIGQPAMQFTQLIQNNNTTNIGTLVQALQLDQGLELMLMKHGPAMPDPIGAVDINSTKTSVALFAFGSFGVGVPITGESSVSTIYINNPGLNTIYKGPVDSNGNFTYKYIGLVENSLNRFYKDYYVGLRLKTFNYTMAKCLSDPTKPCPRVKNEFPGIFDAAWGEDQTINPWTLSGPGVIRIQGDYPLPFYKALHLFGSVYLSLAKQDEITNNVTYQTAGSDVHIGDSDVYQVGVTPSPRDQYRIGMGLDLIQVVKQAMKAKVTISSISPSGKTVKVNGTQQFSATVTGSTDTTIVWSVNGTQGGDKTVGTIDSKGNYTAPSTVTGSSSLQVTITATAHADASQSTTTTLTITSS